MRSHQIKQEQERQESWDRIRNEPRLPSSKHRPWGTGMPQLQLIVSPSFKRSSFWEICRQAETWKLFTSRVVSEWHPGPLMVQGYEQVDIAGDLLSGYFERVIKLSLPIKPVLENWGGLDGTLYRLTLIGNLNSRVEFQWWSDTPEHWQPLMHLADKMAATFSKAAALADESKPM